MKMAAKNLHLVGTLFINQFLMNNEYQIIPVLLDTKEAKFVHEIFPINNNMIHHIELLLKTGCRVIGILA